LVSSSSLDYKTKRSIHRREEIEMKTYHFRHITFGMHPEKQKK